MAGTAQEHLINADPGGPPCCLFSTQSDSMRMNLVMGSGRQNQTSPSTGDIKKLVVGLVVKFSADQLELVAPRHIDAVNRRLKIGAGTAQRTTKPRLIKVDRLGVVLSYRTPISLDRVTFPLLPQCINCNKSA